MVSRIDTGNPVVLTVNAVGNVILMRTASVEAICRRGTAFAVPLPVMFALRCGYQRIFMPSWPSRGLLLCPDNGLVTVPKVLSNG